MLPVDLASQIITHDLQHFRKRVDFLCRMKFCRHHDKEILCCDRIKIWAQIYRNCHADRTRGRHSLHTLRIHTPDINGNKIFIDTAAISVTYLFQLRNLHIPMHNAEFSRSQMLSL